jgi:hypothetical protein
MTMTDPLTPNSVKVRDTTKFLFSGGTQKITAVTYWLGRHGPFELEYPQGQASAVQINNDIAARQAQLRQVLGATPATP